MALIEASEAQAWADSNKVTLEDLEDNLLTQIEADVIARIAKVYDVTTWTTPASTPRLVRKVIAMLYVAAIYNRTYSEDEGLSEYAINLMAQAEMLIEGIVGYTIDLPPNETGNPPLASSTATFYPTDASSAQQPNQYDSSLGGPSFSMGQIW